MGKAVGGFTLVIPLWCYPGLCPEPRPSLGDPGGTVTRRDLLGRAPRRLPENPRPRQGQAATRSPPASLDPAGEPRTGASLPDRGDPATQFQESAASRHHGNPPRTYGPGR